MRKHARDSIATPSVTALLEAPTGLTPEQRAERFAEKRPSLDMQPAEVKNIVFMLLNPEKEYPDAITIDEPLPKITRATSMLLKRDQFKGTVLDPRLGTIDSLEECVTCHQGVAECPGHAGIHHLNQKSYFIAPQFLDQATLVLQSVCHDCRRLKAHRALLEYRGVLLSEGLERLQLIKAISSESECVRRKEGMRAARTQAAAAGIELKKEPAWCRVASKVKAEAGTNTIKVQLRKNAVPTDLDVKQVLEIFEGIPREDLDLMGFLPGSSPVEFVVRSLYVPPPRSRISTRYESRNDDPIGKLFDKMVKQTKILATAGEKKKRPVRQNDGSTKQEDVDPVTEIQSQYIRLLEGPKSAAAATHDFKGLGKTWRGKKGKIRQETTGMRVNNFGRAVVSIAPAEMPIEQALIPMVWRQELTTKEYYAEYNRDYIQWLLREGEAVVVKFGGAHNRPGMFVVSRDRWQTLFRSMRYGDEVHRRIRDGDIMALNRAPTIHRYSIMAHKANLKPQATIGVSIVHAKRAYAGDFDGDEYTAHVIQDIEERAEAIELFSVRACMADNQTNGVIMVPTFEAPLQAMKMTKRTLLPREAVSELLGNMKRLPDLEDLYRRLAFSGVHPLSGRGVFSALLPAWLSVTAKIDDNAMEIVKGVLISGYIDKKMIDIIANVIEHRSVEKSELKDDLMDFVDNANAVLTAYGQYEPTTVSYEDCVDESGELARQHKRLVREAEIILAGGAEGTSEIWHKFAESQTIAAVDNIQAEMTKYMKKQLPRENNLYQMAVSGAKGDTGNIYKILIGPGQIYLKGRRMPLAMTGKTRALGTYSAEDRSLAARGYCASSLMGGLTAEEIIPLQMAARIGLADTSDSTPTAGLIRKLLAAHMTDISVQYDSSVRTSGGRIVQFSYNSDGFEPARIKKTPFPGYTAPYATDPILIANMLYQDHLYSRWLATAENNGN